MLLEPRKSFKQMGPCPWPPAQRSQVLQKTSTPPRPALSPVTTSRCPRCTLRDPSRLRRPATSRLPRLATPPDAIARSPTAAHSHDLSSSEPPPWRPAPVLCFLRPLSRASRLPPLPPVRHPHSTGTPSHGVNLVATGVSIPGMASSAASSSRNRLGRPSEALSSPHALISRRVSSRSPSLSAS